MHPWCDTHLNVLVKSLQGLPASLLVRPVLLSSKQGIAQKISVVFISIYIHFGRWGWGERGGEGSIHYKIEFFLHLR